MHIIFLYLFLFFNTEKINICFITSLSHFIICIEHKFKKVETKKLTRKEIIKANKFF
jgi:hypothetical protein